jgi:hypothetical protein
MIIQEAKINNETFQLESKNNQIAVISNGRKWTANNYREFIVEMREDLSRHPAFLAQVIFQMALKPHYTYISDIEKEKKNYKELIKHEKEHPEDNSILKPSAYGGPYDIDQLSEPAIKDGCLIFYVNQRSTSIPMVVHYPLDESSPSPLVDTLPSKKNQDLKKQGKNCDVQ